MNIPNPLSPYAGRGSVWDFMSEMEKAFEDFWGQAPGATSTSEGAVATRFAPPVDIQETPDYFLMSIDLPGVAESDIKIDLHNGRLHVSGERRAERKEDEAGFRRFERSYGRFERTFQLPTHASEDKIQARHENGVLEIMIPKAEQAKARSIQIEGSKGGLFSKLLKKDSKQQVESKEQKH